MGIESHPGPASPASDIAPSGLPGEGEQLMRLLVGSVKDYAIFALDVRGRVRSWNAGAQAIKGYTAEEIIGSPMERFYTPEDLATGLPARLLGEAERLGRVEDEGWRVRKDGTRFWADVVLTAMRDGAGTLVGFGRVTRDLTERKRAEEERLLLVQAHEAIRLRDDFLPIASHELRTPLTSLKLQLQSLSSRPEELSLRAQDRLARAVRSTERLAGLVEKLLDVSRISSGRFSLQAEAVNLSELCEELVEQMAPAAALACCRLATRIKPEVRGTWDRIRLEQVVLNLLTNAFTYAAGSEVLLQLGLEGERAVLKVSDRGPGIPGSALERIFDRFERASSIRHHGGLGLGLYVNRQIIQAHGGRISAANQPGGGAAFRVELPLRPPRVVDLAYLPRDASG